MKKNERIYLSYNGVNYPVRVFKVLEGNTVFQRVISTDALYMALEESGFMEAMGTEEFGIDQMMYYYVEDDEVLELDAEVICNEHLDIPMKFIEEIF